ncbi:MAG: hypothetical protein HZB38_03105 [Planctomycetes bacterium]|nr:hypothetical protein [Planctomycetota bacterium]
MPLPLVLLKVAFLLKILKYPIFVIVDSLREYRRREQELLHAAGVPVLVERRFFHHPIRSLGDRKFWIKTTTNAAEVIVHVMGLWALGWNLSRRLFCDVYVAWHPHHTPEPLLFLEVADQGWSAVLRETGRWLGRSLLRWPGKRSCAVTLRSARRGARWREVEFDGGFVAARLTPGKNAARARPIGRPGSGYSLRIDRTARDRVVAVVVDEPDGSIRRTVSLS